MPSTNVVDREGEEVSVVVAFWDETTPEGTGEDDFDMGKGERFAEVGLVVCGLVPRMTMVRCCYLGILSRNGKGF